MDCADQTISDAFDFSVAFYLRQPPSLGNVSGEAMRIGKYG